MSLITVPFLEQQFFPIVKRLFLLLPSWSWVYQNGDTEQLLTHGSVPKEHPLSEQGAFLVP